MMLIKKLKPFILLVLLYMLSVNGLHVQNTDTLFRDLISVIVIILIHAAVMVNTSTIYLKIIASNASAKASFEYSIDNEIFKPLGDELMMRVSLKIFTGNKFCLFNYATKYLGGYVNIDWFRVE